MVRHAEKSHHLTTAEQTFRRAIFALKQMGFQLFRPYILQTTVLWAGNRPLWARFFLVFLFELYWQALPATIGTR